MRRRAEAMFAGGKRLSPTEPTGETVPPYALYRAAFVGRDDPGAPSYDDAQRK